MTTASSPAARIASVASSASPANWNVSAITKSTPASAAQATCSSNIARTARRAPGSSRYRLVLQTSPASNVPVSRATRPAIASASRLSGSSRCSLPISRSFSRCP